MKDLNLGMSKQGMEWVLYREDFGGLFDYIKSTDTQIVLEVYSDEGNGLLNIYFKTNGKISFLSQGKNPEAATEFAQKIISYIKSDKYKR
ncbi:hypothetical protein BCEN4_740098 [Burkholderia cenocepacia]|uniref:hypothetical protein n=1 Tax=Burkholderia cenocepacia TaxID=95486 RepID=UPI00192B074F|nr:hypothetical protein [Burkholderia cenocepacia]CAD9227979.1 hypothetical protein BCEN4_740098 [Burkholderia cenocepacia]